MRHQWSGKRAGVARVRHVDLRSPGRHLERHDQKGKGNPKWLKQVCFARTAPPWRIPIPFSYLSLSIFCLKTRKNPYVYLYVSVLSFRFGTASKFCIKRTLKILTKTSNSYCLFYCFNFYSVILNQEMVLFVNLYFV